MADFFLDLAMDGIGERNRANKVRKIARMPANPGRRRCWDWMIVSGSCHYAKNRSSFTEYRRISGTAQGATVLGIGTVKLQVRRSPTNSDTHTLTLENVLHIPSAICNGFSSGLNIVGTERWSLGLTQSYDENERPIWYALDFCGLRRIVLDGNPQGESEIQEQYRKGGAFSLSIYLSKEEEENLVFS